ncbi:hypothetical protein B484DRAFT_430487 [Ochromonadaceae sp. CCMP2298]|nr:hypothetical protein B484DRAFT_430487 [Ochromonadaceae sp. CCMP2298]
MSQDRCDIFNRVLLQAAPGCFRACMDQVKKLRSWLWFEKFILLPAILDERTLALYQHCGIGWFIGKTCETEVDTQLSSASGAGRACRPERPAQPGWILPRNKGLRMEWRNYCIYYWSITLAANLPYRFVYSSSSGVGVLSTTSLFAPLRSGLVGFLFPISSSAVWCAFQQAKYNTLYEVPANRWHGLRRAILFGPLQYVNHDCGSNLGYGTERVLSTRPAHGRIERFHGFRLCPRKFTTGYVTESIEVVCNYNISKPSVFGSILEGDCLCGTCAQAAARSSPPQPTLYVSDGPASSDASDKDYEFESESE